MIFIVDCDFVTFLLDPFLRIRLFYNITRARYYPFVPHLLQCTIYAILYAGKRIVLAKESTGNESTDTEFTLQTRLATFASLRIVK